MDQLPGKLNADGTDITGLGSASALLRAAPSVLYVFDLPTGRLLFCNDPMTSLLGYTPEQLREAGPAIDELLIDPADRHLLRKHRKRLAQAADSEMVETELPLRRADGRWRWMLLREGIIARQADGTPLRSIGTAEDVTDRRQLSERLAEVCETLAEREGMLRLLTAQLTLAEQHQRNRLAQLLHDDLQQLLYALRLAIHRVRRRDESRSLDRPLEEVEQLLNQALQVTRSTAVDLNPPVLEQQGLAAAIEWLARQMKARHGLEVVASLDPAAEPQTADTRILLFQAIRELLFNVVKHAQTDRAEVHMSISGTDDTRIEVIDRGRGLECACLDPGELASGCFGLFSLRQRLDLIGGRLEIHSRPGQGMRTVLCVPQGLNVQRGEWPLDATVGTEYEVPSTE